MGLDPWVRKIAWRRAWQPAPVSLPGEPHGGRSLVAIDHRVTESEMTGDLAHMLVLVGILH